MTRNANRVSGADLIELMDAHDLYGWEGADRIGELLGLSRATVQGYYSKGMPRHKFELLRLKLGKPKRRKKKTA